MGMLLIEQTWHYYISIGQPMQEWQTPQPQATTSKHDRSKALEMKRQEAQAVYQNLL